VRQRNQYRSDLPLFLLKMPQQTALVRRAANTDPVDLFVVEVGREITIA
jgi:hypothetical protein